MALEDLGPLHDPCLDPRHACGIAHAHSDEGRDVETNGLSVEQCVVAADHAALFELAHPFVHCGGSEADQRSQIREALLGIALERVRQLSIRSVQGLIF